MIPIPKKRTKKAGRQLTLAEIDGGQAEGVVNSPDELEGSASKVLLSKGIAAVLERHYPGWNWGITVDEKGGVVHIFALLLSGDMGYTLLLSQVHSDVGLRRIVAAGGEILERYGCRRAGFSLDQFKRVRRGPDGTPVPDVSDLHAKMQARLSRRRGMSV